jgi:hypothetical protein
MDKVLLLNIAFWMICIGLLIVFFRLANKWNDVKRDKTNSIRQIRTQQDLLRKKK